MAGTPGTNLRVTLDAHGAEIGERHQGHASIIRTTVPHKPTVTIRTCGRRIPWPFFPGGEGGVDLEADHLAVTSRHACVRGRNRPTFFSTSGRIPPAGLESLIERRLESLDDADAGLDGRLIECHLDHSTRHLEPGWPRHAWPAGRPPR